MTIFINDTTTNPPREAKFETFHDAVTYLGDMSQRAYGQNRKQRMIFLEELGHGYDDRDSVNFVRSMASAFEMGVIRNDAGQLRRMKCDITSIDRFQSSEFGS